MLQFSDGFDHYTALNTTGVDVRQYLEAAGYTVRNATATTYTIVEGRRAGTLALQMNIPATGTAPPSISRSHITTENVVVFGFALSGKGVRSRICRIENIGDVGWDRTTGKMTFNGQVGPDTLILANFYCYEVELTKSTGRVRIFVNDTLQIDTTVDTWAFTEYVITWGLTVTDGAAAQAILDDFVIVDSAPGANTGRIGPIEVVTKIPTSDEAKQWAVIGSNTTNHFSVVAQFAPNATNAPYLQANASGLTDSFKSNSVLPTENQIFGVAVVAYARKGDLDDRALGMTVGVSTDVTEVAKTLTESYKYLQAVFETTPTGGVWNKNAVESSTFGFTSR